MKKPSLDSAQLRALEDYNILDSVLELANPQVVSTLANAAALNRQTQTMERMISIREGQDPVDELVATRADLNRLLRAAVDHTETPNSFSMDTLREFTNEITQKYK